MLKSYLHVFLIITILLVSSCSDNNSPTSSSEMKIVKDSTEIFHYSFEENGIATLSGWILKDSIANNSISFMNDAPPNEGNWSLKIITNPSYFSYLSYTIKPTETDFKKIFKLSSFIKGSQTAVSLSQIHMFVWTSDGSAASVGVGTGNISDWTNISCVTDTINSQVDSLVLVISIYCNRSGEQFLFDGLKIIENQYHY